MNDALGNTLVVFRMMHRLESAHRYSQIQMTREENVMEHIGFVCTMIQVLWYKWDRSFDLGLALSKAVVHDLDETITGDVPRTTKYASKSIREEFEIIEAAGVRKLCEGLAMNPEDADEFFNLWSSAKDHSPEGMVVKYVDLLAVVYRLWVEVLLKSNMGMLTVATGVRRYLTDLQRSDTSSYSVGKYIEESISNLIDIVDVMLEHDSEYFRTPSQGT